MASPWERDTAPPTIFTFFHLNALVEISSPTLNQDGGTETPISFTSASGILTNGVFTQPALPTNRAVILCHGFLSNKNSRTNRRLTELLISESIATLRFDWFGMGDSREPLPHISIHKCTEQLEAAFRFLTEKPVNPVGLIGSSFGGFIAILAASRHPHLQALGLKCPVVDFSEVLQCEFGPEGMAQWKRTNHIPDILGGDQPIPLPYAFFEECLTYNGYDAASHIHTPTLIVHGEQDAIIPPHQIDRILESLSGPKDLRVIPGADHYFGRPEDFRVMTTHLANWLIDRVSSS
jgi:uncharacterized protein